MKGYVFEELMKFTKTKCRRIKKARGSIRKIRMIERYCDYGNDYYKVLSKFDEFNELDQEIYDKCHNEGSDYESNEDHLNLLGQMDKLVNDILPYKMAADEAACQLLCHLVTSEIKMKKCKGNEIKVNDDHFVVRDVKLIRTFKYK